MATRHSDVVLKALLPSSRTEQGRLAIGATPGAIDNIVCVLRDPLAFYEPLGELEIRLLRNICARSPANQNRCATAKAHELIIQSIEKRFDFCDGDETGEAAADSLVLKRMGNDESDQRLKLPFFGFAVEFLVNFVTSNSENAELVWKLVYPDLISKLLNCANHAAASAAAALLHNCIAVVPHRMSDVVSIWTSEHGDSRSLAESLVQHIRQSDEDGSEKFSWSFMIIRRLVAASFLQAAFEALGPTLKLVTESETPFSEHQLTLMQVLDASASKSAETEDGSDITLQFTDETNSFLAQLLEAALWTKNGDMLQIGGSIVGSVILLSEDSPSLNELRMRGVKVAVNVLQAVAAYEHGNKKENRNQDKEKITTKDMPMSGLKAIMVRLVALCCDLCRPAQESVRKLQGLPFILNATSYESDVTRNPFLREWAILAIRNLTLDNQENANEISSYELMGVEKDTEFLKKAGLEAFMDPVSNRPKVRVKTG